MYSLENKILECLIDLKENFFVTGVKAEFESEGTKLEEAIKLKELVQQADLNLTIKVGGCEAIKDIEEAKSIGINALVAPMIESSYAMQKYVNATNFVFSEQEKKVIDFYINIETITGFKNLKEIINDPCFEQIKGIVIGRADMCGSMKLNKNEIDSPQIFNIAKEIAIQNQSKQKELIIGGRVSGNSIPFFQKLPENTLTKFETRKIIFDAKALNLKEIKLGILKALEFELLWLKNKENLFGTLEKKDELRLKSINTRYQNLLSEIGGVYV